MTWQQIEKTLRENNKNLLKKARIAVGIGYKSTDGEKTFDLAIICSVEKKLPLSKLTKKDLIPSEINGIKTDVIETGIIKALHTNKHRPAPGGVSIGHIDITAGTLGCVVKNADIRYILSNNHVLANSNAAQIGDAILQPGIHDGGAFPVDHIAELSDFVPINFSGVPSECPVSNMFVKMINGVLYIIGSKTRLQTIKQAEENLVDAAIARPLKDENVSNEILEIGKIEGIKPALLGMRIKKSGRTTELTTGEIQQVGVTVNVQYGEGKIATFTDQLMAGAMSAGGDSGSVILTENNELTGLLFAGSDTTTICNRIENVFELLEINL